MVGRCYDIRLFLFRCKKSRTKEIINIRLPVTHYACARPEVIRTKTIHDDVMLMTMRTSERPYDQFRTAPPGAALVKVINFEEFGKIQNFC